MLWSEKGTRRLICLVGNTLLSVGTALIVDEKMHCQHVILHTLQIRSHVHPSVAVLSSLVQNPTLACPNFLPIMQSQAIMHTD